MSCMSEDRLKSAYELAMERFQKKDADAGIVHRPLTDEQKAAIADVRSRYQAKLAELEILHHGKIRSMMDPAEREAAEEEYRRDRDRTTRDREAKIEEIRASNRA